MRLAADQDPLTHESGTVLQFLRRTDVSHLSAETRDSVYLGTSIHIDHIARHLSLSLAVLYHGRKCRRHIQHSPSTWH